MLDISREIIKKAASGDMGAFGEIYRTFSSTVYTVAFNITHNRQDAEEVTQDVFVKIFKKLDNFKFESAFSTWLYRITMNAAINTYHSRARRNKGTVNIENVDERIMQKAGASEDSQVIETALTEAGEILNHLSSEHRSCIVLREIEGLDYKEMAEVLNIPLNTVRTRLKRAREALRAYCAERGACHGL